MVSTTDEIVNEVAPVEVQQPAEVKSISDEEFEKAQKLFQLGKKNLFLNKYDESVNNIGDACKTYASKFGEMDPQCAEVYFFYGRALLELARIENTVLGNALTGVPEENEPINDSRYGNPEEMTADEKNEISEKVIEALCSTEEEIKNGEAAKVEETKTEETTAETKTDEEPKCEEVKPATETTTTTATTTTEEKTEETKQETSVVAAEKMETTTGETTDDTTTPKPESDKTTEEEKKEEEEGEGEEEDEADEEEAGEEETAEGANKEDAEDISNLQSSWEMFELAKLIYTKNFDEDKLFKNKRIAECLLKLGEISIEQEIYEQAITDITESIRVQEEIECADRDERMLAESYYQLGLTKQFNNMMTEAKDAYQRSINIVQLRVEKLKGKLLGLEGSTGEDCESEKTRINEEISELEALMPEMSSKLEECNEPCAETLERIKEAKECFVASEGLKPATTANGDVKDITSLVKSKRKIENGCEEGGATNGNTKKTKMSDEGEEELEEKCTEEKMEEKCAEETTATTTTTTTTVETEKIEIDENKEENKENVETKAENEGSVKMEESKTEVAADEAVVETAATATITETTTAEPIASA